MKKNASNAPTMDGIKKISPKKRAVLIVVCAFIMVFCMAVALAPMGAEHLAAEKAYYEAVEAGTATTKTFELPDGTFDMQALEPLIAAIIGFFFVAKGFLRYLPLYDFFDEKSEKAGKSYVFLGMVLLFALAVVITVVLIKSL